MSDDVHFCGNLNDIVGEWPAVIPTRLSAITDWWPRPVPREPSVAERCALSIAQAAAAWEWEQALQGAGWQASSEVLPEADTPCYILLVDRYGQIDDVPEFAVYRGQGLWDEDLRRERVAYWWALPRPPGPVQGPQRG